MSWLSSLFDKPKKPKPVKSVLSSEIPKLYELLKSHFEQAETERKQKYTQGLGDLARVTELFGPGYGAGMKKAALAGMEQGMVGRGLGGTTRPAAVGAGMSAQFEDLRRDKMADALTRVAEYRRVSPQSTVTAGTLAGLSGVSGYGPMAGGEQPSLMQGFASSLLGGAGAALGGSIAGPAGAVVGGSIAGGITNWFGGGNQVASPLQSAYTGTGAATYGVGGGFDSSPMDNFLKTYTPQTGDYSIR